MPVIINDPSASVRDQFVKTGLVFTGNTGRICLMTWQLFVITLIIHAVRG